MTEKAKMTDGLQAWREAGSPVLSPWEKLRDRPSLKRAVTAKCCDCMGWEENAKSMPSGLRKDVRDCTSTKCPLYVFRPWQSIK